MNISGTFELFRWKVQRSQDNLCLTFTSSILKLTNFHETLYDHVIKDTNMTAKLLKWNQKGIMNHTQTCKTASVV
jgi:hypothetical protein